MVNERLIVGAWSSIRFEGCQQHRKSRALSSVDQNSGRKALDQREVC